MIRGERLGVWSVRLSVVLCGGEGGWMVLRTVCH